MKKRTHEEVVAHMNALAQDNLARKDPEVERRIALRMGATQEEAEEAARWAERHNERLEKNSFGTAKAS